MDRQRFAGRVVGKVHTKRPGDRLVEVRASEGLGRSVLA